MSEAPKRPRRCKAVPAPTTPDRIEIAMEAAPAGHPPEGRERGFAHERN